MTDQHTAREASPSLPLWTEMADLWFDFWTLGARNTGKFWHGLSLLPHPHPHDQHSHLEIPDPIARAPEQDLFA